ncbi:MAG: flippase [Syntrophobacteraceae bacterium]
MSQCFDKGDIQKIAKGTGISFVGSIVGRGLFFVTQVVIARLLGVEIFGLFAIGFAAVKIGDIIASLGLNTGGMRFVSIFFRQDAPRLKGVLNSSVALSLLNGLLLGAVLYLLSMPISVHIFHKPELAPILRMFAMSLPFASAMMVLPYLLQGFHTTKYTVYVREFVQPSVNLLLIVGFYFAGFGVAGVIYAFLLSNLAGCIAGIYFVRKLFPQFTKPDIKPVYEVKKLLAYSAPLFLVNFLHFFLSFTDTLMLGSLGSAEDVGIYQAASQLPMVMLMFIVACNSIYAPVVADLYHKSEMRRIAGVLKTTTRWASYAAIPLFILLIFSSRELMLLFGKGYVEKGSIVLLILSVRQLINCMTGGVGVTLSMTSKQNVEAWNSVAMLVLNIGMNYALIPRYGVLGAAVSSCISGSLINILRVVEVALLYKMHPFSKVLIKYAVPSFLSVALLLLLSFVPIRLEAIGLFSIKTAIVVLLFSLFFLISKNLAEEDDFIYRKIIAVFQKAKPAC